MLRQLAAVLLFLFALAPLCAQDVDTTEPIIETLSMPEEPVASGTSHTGATVRYDSSTVSVRDAEQALQKLRRDPDLSYERDITLNPTLWDQIKAWLWRILEKIWPDEDSTMGTVWKVVYYVVIGAILVYVIFRLTGTSFIGLFGKSGRRVVETSMLEENIHELDFEKLIAEAAAEKQYRKAVRLMYLRSLKELSDGNYIHWSIDKTNREYLSELSTTDLRKNFEQLTLLFEYIWYGDFPVDYSLFDRSRELFQHFSTMTVQHV